MMIRSSDGDDLMLHPSSPSSLLSEGSENGSKLVGVLGGLGPEASVDFMARVMKNTPATIDQEHVRMLVHHNPHVPSRQDAILGKGESPGPYLAAMAACLERAGADFIVMPCNLGHYWHSEIADAITIPFISIVEATVAAAIQVCDSSTAMIGLITTPGCFNSGLYQEAVKRADYRSVLQTRDELKQTMEYVHQIKAGSKSEQVVNGLREIGSALVSRGANVLIAACTELPLVLDETMFEVPFISSTEELAKHTITMALGTT